MKKNALRFSFVTLVSVIFLSQYVHLSSDPIEPWIIMDIKDLTLSEQERWMLQQPNIAGVVLTLAKSYGNPSIGGKKYPNLATVKHLTNDIHAINHELLIFIDYEGGNIIRIEDENLPHIPLLRDILQHTPEKDRTIISRQVGQKVGRILKDIGADVLLGPVLDLSVNGSPLEYRGISTSTELVTRYGSAYMNGIMSTGIIPVLKHFPGLGYTTQDTHLEQTYDNRPNDAVFDSMQPFIDLIHQGESMVMPSHAIYSEVDLEPATTSQKWHNILRNDIGFRGKIITDDTSMGALSAHNTNFKQHIESIHQAGNDYVLIMHKQDMLYLYLKSIT